MGLFYTFVSSHTLSQGARTATNIDRLFQSLARDYPNLDPATFIKELGSLLDSLATNTLDLTCESCGLGEHPT